jgi:two-component system OmpR family sensor kinase
MASTRARLTISYAVVLLGTMVAFGMAIWFERRNADKDELGREALRVADNVFLTIQASPLRSTFVDTAGSGGPIIRNTKDLADVLDPVPGYFMVLDKQGRLLYSSALMRLLSGDDQTILLRYVLQLEAAGGLSVPGVSVPVRGDSLRLFAVVETNPTSQSIRVVAALPTNLSELPPQLLIGTMIVLAPIIFVVSVIVAYLVVGNSFRPVEQLMNEVEAITDGRSLHRRLPADSSND